MPQQINLDLHNKAAKQLNQGAKAIMPDMLANIIVPETAGTDPSDFANPVGMAGKISGGLLGALLKRFKSAPTRIPDPPSRDPFGLDPKMDRREFLRRTGGKRMHDATRAIHHNEDNPIMRAEMVDDVEAKEWLGRDYNKFKGMQAVENKLVDKYWPVDDSYLEEFRKPADTIKRLGKALSSNFTNEVRQGLTHDTKEGFEKGLDEAGEGTAKLMDTLIKRLGIRK